MQFPLESFLVNLASSEGPKFLQLQMQLELSSPSVEEELIRKKAVIRDSIISLLTSRSYNDLRRTEGMEKLRSDIKGRVNNLLSTGKIQQVFFTQFHFN
ncbi:MAG: flagellar basal body-associated FliL family protein [Bdellovibrionota bacterium]